MRVADVARELGFSPDWIRRMEREGRIPPAPRDLNNHRRYRPKDVKRLRELLFPVSDDEDHAVSDHEVAR